MQTGRGLIEFASAWADNSLWMHADYYDWSLHPRYDKAARGSDANDKNSQQRQKVQRQEFHNFSQRQSFSTSNKLLLSISSFTF